MGEKLGGGCLDRGGCLNAYPRYQTHFLIFFLKPLDVTEISFLDVAMALSALNICKRKSNSMSLNMKLEHF